jgi:DNA-binding beta-propeller fold protein YncE
MFGTNDVCSIFASTGLDSPEGLAFDSAGNLYVANADYNTIEKFGTNSVGSVFASTGMDSPKGLAFDSAGNLYVAEPLSNTIEEFGTNGVGSVFASTGLDDPTFIATQVPETSTLTLVGLGLSAVVVFRRRKA